MTTKILRTVSLGLIFLTTFIPLYVDNSLFFPFITGKAFAFRIIVEILLALWLLLVLRDKKYAPRFSWLSVLVTAFTVVVLIADLAGVNPVRSIWSNFERMEGWVTIFHLWAYFIATASIFGSGEEGRRMWHNLFRVSLFAAVIVGIYGVVQLAGGAAIHQGSTRIDASLGNAAYMAVYMLGHVFMAFYLAMVDWVRNKKGTAWMYIVLGVFFAFLLFETSTRGTILGLVGGLSLAALIFALFGKGYSTKARAWSGAVIIVFVLLGAGLVAAKNTPFVKSHETLNRLATISLNAEGQARAYIWPMAVKGAFENPKTAIIGWGQENFNYIFNANYNPKMWNQEQWFDRAHSVFLDWLVAGGLLAVLLYISLFVFALISVWKSSLTFAEKALLTGFFVAYGIHNIFVFDNIASYILFFTLLGFAHSINSEKTLRWFTISDTQTENQIVVRDYIYAPVIVIVLLIALYMVNVRPIQANHRLIAAMTSCTGQGSPSADLFAQALKYNQYVANQEIREQLLSCAGGVINSPAMPTETKMAFYDLAGKEISKQLAATPNDARVLTLGGVFFNDISDWKNGAPLLEKAVELSPGKQSTIFELAQNYMNNGKEKEALELLKQAYESAPENETAKIGYMSALVLNGQEAKAKELAGANQDIFLDPRFIGVYVKRKEYDKVIAAYKTLIAKNPDNIQYYASLAATYNEIGQKNAAVAQLELMKTKFPLYKEQIEQAISQVKGIPVVPTNVKLNTEVAQ